MIETLSVSNYALLDDVRVDFHNDFNVLTGETGTGKSLLVGALGLVLGQKTDASVIREGRETATVSALFLIPKGAASEQWLINKDIPIDEGTLSIRRVIKRTGRSACYIGEAPVSRTDLVSLAALLVDMHSQHENQSLFDPNNQKRLLDRFAGITADTTAFGDILQKLNTKKRELKGLREEQEKMLLQMDYYKSMLLEIEDANLVPGEEEEIEKRRHILVHHEEITSLVNTFIQGAGRGIDAIRESREELERIGETIDSFAPLVSRHEGAFLELEDIYETVKEYQRNYSYDPSELMRCDERLSIIRNITKKHGKNVDDLLEFATETQNKVTFAEDGNDEIKELEEEVLSLESKLREVGNRITRLRNESAGKLQSRILEHLSSLGMARALFTVSVDQKKNAQGKLICQTDGFDSVAFLLDANGANPKALRDVASGGEISRVMLAIKSVLLANDPVPTLIFDEVDTGIGGEIAIRIGEHLRDLATQKQVLCITHLATIAAFGDNHIRIVKISDEADIKTVVETIDNKERQMEISRMLAGDQSEDVSLKHAEDLLRRSQKR